MNKLNLLLLISLVFIASSCDKIELPEPKEEEPEFGFWSGQIGTTPMIMNNDSMIMATKIIADPVLKVNTFETTFTTLGSTKPQWIFKYRDSKSMRTAADTADLFYISKPEYLKDTLANKAGYMVTHSLEEIEHGNEVIWTHDGKSIEGGRHFSVETGGFSGVMKVKAEIVTNGKTNSIEKIYALPIPGIDLRGIEINGNEISFQLDAASTGNPNIYYKMDSSPPQENKFTIQSSGHYNFEIFNTNRSKQLFVKLYLEVSNGSIKPPNVPLFISEDIKSYPTRLPNFSKMEIIYFDEDGIEFSSRYNVQDKPFIIREIETFDKTNQQGQKVKKLDIEFSVKLQTADGSKSINFNGVKGDIGFAYE